MREKESGAPDGNSSSDPVSPSELESFRHAIEEARRTHDQQLTAFEDIDNKAWRLVQLNGIISTIYVSAVANALELLSFTVLSKVVIVLGLVFIGLSTILGIVGQRERSVKVGQSPESFESLRKNYPDEFTYLDETLCSYERWIGENEQKTTRNDFVVTIGKLSSLVGIGFITVGLLISVELL
jgi:hypothetical protein